MSAKQLTPRQREILKFISEFIEKYKFPPTRSELSSHFGFRSPNAAESHLRALEKKAMIGIERGVSRGIILLPMSTAELPARGNPPLPLVGRVAAGSPVLAEENIEDEYRVDPALFPRKPHYLLRVTGMSMRGAGILDGDLLAVHLTVRDRARLDRRAGQPGALNYGQAMAMSRPNAMKRTTALKRSAEVNSLHASQISTRASGRSRSH